ncbi:hypothetical protein VNI00_010074 [Paramarasmius palmivorus]|uniref:Aminoglycoside phosphotransferase domain-containing protein n=1 Tax=Paramarasmius palmivorus TaxID=297713 RepID=A0AAW0CGG8_9AGAR
MAQTTTISIKLPSEAEPTSFHLVSQDVATHRLGFSSFEVSHIQLGSGMYEHFGPIELCGAFDQPVKPSIILFCTPIGKDASDVPLIVLKAFFHTDISQKFLSGAWEECRNAMEEEARFYQTSLSEFQGVLVPKHYGIWRSDSTSTVGIVECQILQYCGKAIGELELRDKENLAIATATERLHDYGIYHGQLSIPEIEHHILCNHEGKVFIVDFSEALDNWLCIRTIPLVPLQVSLMDVAEDTENKGKMQLCDELGDVATFLGFGWCDSGCSKEVLGAAALSITGKTVEERRIQFEGQRRSLENQMATYSKGESEEGLVPGSLIVTLSSVASQGSPAPPLDVPPGSPALSESLSHTHVSSIFSTSNSEESCSLLDSEDGLPTKDKAKTMRFGIPSGT